MIAATEERLDRKFTPAEIRDGTFAELMIDADFDILKKVEGSLPTYFS